LKEMKRLLKSALARLGYRLEGTRYTPRQLLDPGSIRPVEFDDIVCRRVFESGPQLTFIQIGAFDGITHDPLRKYVDKCGWRGILVEPQSRIAERLRQLYRANNRVVIIQAALDREVGIRTLFTIDSASAPAWTGALASFDREHILKHSHLIPGLEDLIREESVQCITFDELLRQLPSDRLDLLQIDAEGADEYILSLFPFDRIRPAIIHWEIGHLSQRQREQSLDRLTPLGYRFAGSGTQDMMAVLS
jgi:FkbM family methyltransferase